LNVHRIKELREQKGWSQAELADKLGVHRITIVRIENGKSKNIELLSRIADLFGVSLKEFF